MKPRWLALLIPAAALAAGCAASAPPPTFAQQVATWKHGDGAAAYETIEKDLAAIRADLAAGDMKAALGDGWDGGDGYPLWNDTGNVDCSCGSLGHLPPGSDATWYAAGMQQYQNAGDSLYEHADVASAVKFIAVGDRYMARVTIVKR